MEHTIETITRCEVLSDEQGVNTDHFPIVTELDLEMAITKVAETRNFRDVDWKEFRKKLEGKATKRGVPNFIRTQGELNQKCRELTNDIQETIKEVVPKNRTSPHAKRWWTKELTKLRQEMMQSRRKASKSRHESANPHWERFKEARRKLGSEIEKAKRNHWRDWLEKSSDPDLWTAHRYVTAPAVSRSGLIIFLPISFHYLLAPLSPSLRHNPSSYLVISVHYPLLGPVS